VRILRLAVKQDKALRVPAMEMLKEAPPREGLFEDREFHRIRWALPEDLQVAVTIAQTYGWRMESEAFPLERRHLDLEVGTLRLDPGTTKNSEGQIVYLTPDLNAMLAAQIRQGGRALAPARGHRPASLSASPRTPRGHAAPRDASAVEEGLRRDGRGEPHPA
jgi:integrase